ncbi:MAG: aminotransferase class IV [Terracidiphilus sp.]
MTQTAKKSLYALGLQQPRFAYFNGEVRPWEEATLHVSCEAVNRGLNVFEGLKGYWQADGLEFGIVELRRHYDRLCRSARLLHIPVPVTYEEFRDACSKIVRALYEPTQDMWIRATLFVVEGHWGEGTVADLYLTAYHQAKHPPAPVAIGVSTWQRSNDVSLSPRIKASTNYQVARLARIEGRKRGFSEMILLNQQGRVAEATGACVLLVRDGCVVTPPAFEGRLESITLEIVRKICHSLAIPYIERPVDRTELHIADEIRLIGTLAELAPVTRVDEYELPSSSPLTDLIAETFWAAVRGVTPHPAVELTFV